MGSSVSVASALLSPTANTREMGRGWLQMIYSTQNANSLPSPALAVVNSTCLWKAEQGAQLSRSLQQLFHLNQAHVALPACDGKRKHREGLGPYSWKHSAHLPGCRSVSLMSLGSAPRVVNSQKMQHSGERKNHPNFRRLGAEASLLQACSVMNNYSVLHLPA